MACWFVQSGKGCPPFDLRGDLGVWEGWYGNGKFSMEIELELVESSKRALGCVLVLVCLVDVVVLPSSRLLK